MSLIDRIARRVDPDLIYSVPDLMYICAEAGFLRSRQTFYNYIRRGELVATRIDRRYDLLGRDIILFFTRQSIG
jgi:hypothetical protein